MARKPKTEEQKKRYAEKVALDRKNNPEKYKEKDRQNYLKRREKALKYAKKYREENGDIIKKRQKTYRDSERGKEIKKQWYESNFEKMKKYHDERNEIHNPIYYAKNKEKMALRRKTDPEYRERCNRWAKNNKAKRCYMASKRRAAKLNATPNWLDEKQHRQIERLYKYANILTKKTGILYTVDHIFPLQGKYSCGLHVPWNLTIIDMPSNSSKSNKEPDIYEIMPLEEY